MHLLHELKFPEKILEISESESFTSQKANYILLFSCRQTRYDELSSLLRCIKFKYWLDNKTLTGKDFVINPVIFLAAIFYLTLKVSELQIICSVKQTNYLFYSKGIYDLNLFTKLLSL